MTLSLIIGLLFQYDVSVNDLCHLWNRIYEKIQYGTVDRKIAGKALRAVIKQIHDRVEIPPDSAIFFPLKGHGLEDIGGQGKGFIRRQYNFLHGNVHRGHPAHDIFIKDRDMDGNDDKTGRRVLVLAMSGGIVVGKKTDWTEDDDLRGGNYLMIYNPNLQRYFYYAHNDSNLVNVGDKVRAGTPVATVGRTGRNANKSKSPTHLHLMVLQISSEIAEPYNYYDDLKNSVFTNR